MYQILPITNKKAFFKLTCMKNKNRTRQTQENCNKMFDDTLFIINYVLKSDNFNKTLVQKIKVNY